MQVPHEQLEKTSRRHLTIARLVLICKSYLSVSFFYRDLSLCLVVLSPVLFAGCGGAHASAPSASAIAGTFQAQAARNDERATQQLDIYVDGSLSMRGFAAAQDSNYSRIAREVVSSATTASFDVNIYKFTSTISKVTNLPLGQLQSPDFYNGSDTPLASLLNHLAPDHSVIVLTDLVQSDKGTDNLDLVRAFTALGARKLEIRLLGYRSSFRGEYYPENLPKRRHFPVELSQAIPNSGRPFYMLVIAPNPAAMKRLDEYILRRNPATRVFDATAPSIWIDAVYLYSDNPKKPEWSLYSPPQFKQTAIPHFESSYRFRNTGRSNGAEVMLPLEFVVKAGHLLQSPAHIEFESTKSTWKGGKGSEPISWNLSATGEFYSNASAKREGTVLPGDPAENASEKMRLQFQVPRPERQSWDVYSIRMKAGQANLKVPEWVKDWNTEDDNLLQNANRTFQLKLVVEAMINAVSEHTAFAECILRLGGEE